MNAPQNALLLIGSPKPKESSSESLGAYLFEELETDGALAGDDLRIVKGMDEGAAFFFAAGALVAALAGFFLAGRVGFAAGFFLAGLRASLRRLGVAFALARAFLGVAFFRTDIAEISGNLK